MASEIYPSILSNESYHGIADLAELSEQHQASILIHLLSTDLKKDILYLNFRRYLKDKPSFKYAYYKMLQHCE